MAGAETTSSILRWSLLYLINFPELQEQLYENIKVGKLVFLELHTSTQMKRISEENTNCLCYIMLEFEKMQRRKRALWLEW